MTRKFSELSQSEQIYFNSLVEFMKESWNEDISNKFKVIQRFRLDPNDPVVFDFLMGVYVPPPPPAMPVKDDIPPPPVPRPHHENPDRLDPPVSISELGERLKRSSLSVNEPSLPVAATATQSVEKTKKREMTYANSEDLIIIQNRLLHAISHLTLNERRLILFLSPIVRKTRERNYNTNSFVVRAVDFANEYNLNKDKVYQVLEETADTILEKAFWFWNFKNNNSFGERTHKTGLSWVTRCDYMKKKGELVVELHNSVIEMLTIFDGSGDKWTKYQKEWITKLGSYGIIMLEIVLSSKYLSSPDDDKIKGYITIEHLREKFDCIDSYEKFSNFRIWVIDRAIQEIHKNTPIRIEYKIHKNGRSVTALSFFYNDISEEKNIIQEKTKKCNENPKENNPFVNFKMTQKQLSLFASKIKKATGQNIDEIIGELCNVHLQNKHVDFLKVLDFVPSDWYSDDEIKEHPTPEKMTQEKQKTKQEIKSKAKLEKIQFEQDYEVLLANAEEFVLANQKRIGVGIEKMYFEQGDYQAIVGVWRDYLLDKKGRKSFAMLREILARY